MYEQELICCENGKIIIPFSTFDFLYKNDDENGYGLADFLPKYSPFYIKIESYRDLGQEDFEYICTFYWGTKEVILKRIGCFLSYKSKYYYLENNLYQLLEKIDSFNSADKSKKNKTYNLKEFAEIKQLIEKINYVEIDRYIDNENVVTPNKIKLNIVENNGKISIEPTIDDVNEKSLSTQYNLANEVQDIYDTDENGRRTRVILNEDIKAATEHLKKEYSNKKFTEIEEELKNPHKIFNELEGIDQDVIDYQGYGDRVKGIGEYAFKPNCRFNSSGVQFLENIDFSNLSDDKCKEILNDLKPVLVAKTIDDEEIEVPINADIIQEMEEAIERNDDVVKISTPEGKPVHVPINEDLKTFVKDSKKLLSDEENIEEKKKRVKKYLLIHDNFEEETYVEYQNVNEEKELIYQRPNSLKNYLKNKNGEEKVLELFDYQKEGVAWLETYYEEQHKKGALLADDMGLGKTLQVLTFLAWLIEKKEQAGEEIKPILVVAPPILLQNWYDEIKRFFENDGNIFTPISILHGEEIKRYKKYNIGPESFVHRASLCTDCKNCELNSPRGCSVNKVPIEKNRIVITNYDTVKNYQFSLGKIEWLSVILDEAQAIKEPETAVTFSIKQLNASFKLAMTGTPVENKLLDLWSIMDFASPGLLGSKKEFLKQYDVPNDIEPTERENRLNALRTTLKLTKFKGLGRPNTIPYIIRREKIDYLADKLPVKHDGENAIRIECEIPNEMAEIHQALLQQAMETDKKHHLMIIQQLIKLYQHKSLLESSNKDYTVDEYLKMSPKLVSTMETLKSIQAKGEKVLIFVTSINMQNILKKVIDRTFGLNVGIINGTVNNKVSVNSESKGARYKILNDFEAKDGFNVLILSPHVAGIGLTILGANHVIHYGRWWNPAKESQATDRAYRIGQEKEVYVYYPIYKSSRFETFDQKLDRLLENKRKLAKDFLTPINDLEISTSDILMDFSEVKASKPLFRKTVNIDKLDKNQFKKLVYMLLKKQGKSVKILNDKNSLGFDLFIQNQNDVNLVNVYTDSIDELDVDSFIYALHKFNKSASNFIFTSKHLDKKIINYINENNIVVFDKGSIEKEIRKYNIAEVDVLSIVPEKCDFTSDKISI